MLEENLEKLLLNELHLEEVDRLSQNENDLVSSIKNDFPRIVGELSVDFSKIQLAVLYGSLARKEQLPYSDIDVECYTSSDFSTEEIFYWRNKLMTFYVVPFENLFNELKTPSLLLWYKSGFNDAEIIYDESNWRSKIRDLINEKFEETNYDSNISREDFNKNVRRFVEYRRKLNNALLTGEKMYRLHSSKCFIDSYLYFNYMSKGIPIKSERELYSNFSIISDDRVRLIENTLDINSSNSSVKESTDILYRDGVEIITNLK